MNARLFKNASYLFLLIAILYLFELKFYLAWSIWWYDMVLHFLSGILVGIVTTLIFHKFFYKKDDEFLKIFVSAMVSIVFVGIAWEIYELYFEMTSFSDGMNYYIDTSSDLFLDIVGALFGVWYGLAILKKETKQ
ncbi:MAG: hypothetical protein A2566_02715 [Candidatus Zambryskibacteria bacterium RIFOXYD1_FULL_40_13]|nr:MAG: hypothetical protein UU06_C0038G0005 [Parcubacteria group bacterium GW2011_GWB1_40_5]OHB15054.1 MAG: hypothetical protein A2566_02715 [Candidatus Zambryskibacteria bacterium RIFOXYD1_FULL_40_13]HBD24610.1 hypothetical protein [Candidatus Zambryskibacteria bacterium]HBO17425.1 hypothetical protein [Candidatus Zambryskibacteria bacterium]HBZ04222.1 hypothetical protein [Candidatus Zambryskibacteria bacterium]